MNLTTERLNLRAERLRRGYSLRAMAAEIGVTTRVLQSAETGATPHASNALKIAEFYGVDVLSQWPLEERSAA